MENKEVVMRIKMLIEDKKVSSSGFAKLIGFNQSNFSKILRGEREVPTNLVNAICDGLNVPYMWLVNGNGSMHLGDITQSGNGNNNANIGSGTQTNNDNRSYYNGCGNEENAVKLAEPIAGATPFYEDMPVSAGEGELATALGSMKPTGWISMPGMPKSIGAFPVVGCSMEPDIKAGDFIAVAEVERWEAVDPEKVYMVITRDDRMINHTDPKMSITELYIRKDFKAINVANSEVLNFVLGQTDGMVRADLTSL